VNICRAVTFFVTHCDDHYGISLAGQNGAAQSFSAVTIFCCKLLFVERVRAVAYETGQVAGWFEDPWKQGVLRFYNGKEWTGYVLGTSSPEQTFNFFTGYKRNAAWWEHELIRVRGSLTQSAPFSTNKNFGFRVLGLIPGFVGLFVLWSSAVSLDDKDFDLNKVAESFLFSAFTIFLCLGAASVLYFKYWKRYVLIKDTPTVNAGGAHLGLCEVQGVVEPYHPPVRSFVMDRLCVWTTTSLQENIGKQNQKNFMERYRVAWGSPVFYLRDERSNSRILIDASYVASKDWQTRLSMGTYEAETAYGTSKHARRIDEKGLEVGKQMYAIGVVQVTPEGIPVMAAQAYPGNMVRETRKMELYPTTEDKVAKTAHRQFVLSAVQAGGLNLLFWLFAVMGLLKPSALSLILGLLAGLTSLAVGTIVSWVWRVWNRLTEAKWRIAAAWSLIDVASNRRHVLIPQLNEVAQGSATHERELQEQLASLRTPTVQEIEHMEKLEKQDNALVVQLKALAEATPDLKTNEAFSKLFQELVNSENRITAARIFYNDAITVAETLSQQFPTSLIAKSILSSVPPKLSDP
jgi:LemA protein